MKYALLDEVHMMTSYIWLSLVYHNNCTFNVVEWTKHMRYDLSIQLSLGMTFKYIHVSSIDLEAIVIKKIYSLFWENHIFIPLISIL